MKVTQQYNPKKLVRRAEAEFGDLATTMFQIAEQGARFLRANDSYTDRTGDLRISTLADVDDANGNDIEVTLEMDTHYAKYVVARGFSEVEEVAEVTGQRMDRAFNAMGRRLSK